MIAVVDSGGANISSIVFALQRIGAKVVFTHDAAIITEAERVILPGVGTAQIAMNRLQQLNLIDCICSLKQPVLGICLGMQILFEHSMEGNVDLLGIFPGNLMRFDEAKSTVVPHIGWNTVRFNTDHKLFYNVPQDSHFYFVHSYYALKNENTLAKISIDTAEKSIHTAENQMSKVGVPRAYRRQRKDPRRTCQCVAFPF